MSKMGLRGQIQWSKVENALRSSGTVGTRQALEVLLERSRRLVPRDTGKLADSGRVEMEGDQGRVLYETDYAVIQHERTDFAHPGGGQAKYLEDPANDPAVQREMLEALGEQLRQGLK